jgi:hypothetical protein
MSDFSFMERYAPKEDELLLKPLGNRILLNLNVTPPIHLSVEVSKYSFFDVGVESLQGKSDTLVQKKRAN